MVGAEPEGSAIEEQGFGWKNSFGSGKGVDTITSGLEGAWTPTPITWDNSYFDTLFGYEWELTKSPAGANQWRPKGGAAAEAVPDAHDGSRRHAPMMATTDIALREEPAYAKISKHFHENPDAFADAFARAWFKLTHRDMGPIARYLGPEVPKEELIWQDPVPTADNNLIDTSDISELKSQIMNSGLGIGALVSAAWGSASTFRGTDKRGGANGARIQLAPQKYWEVNEPQSLSKVIDTLTSIKSGFNSANSKQVSLADLIVLGGAAAIEAAAKAGGHNINVPFTPGRTDATASQTDVDSFAVLEPKADGFRNYLGKGHDRHAEELLLDRSHLLTLTAPEMTVLIGGMRVLGTNTNRSSHGVFTHNKETLSNDFFVNLLDMSTAWKTR